MAPSYKCVFISLLLVFTDLQPSAAIRSAEPEAPAPAPRGDRHTQLKFFFSPDFPCLPFLPKILLDICHTLFPPPTPSPPKRTGCRAPLKERFVQSCAGFLTNSSVSAPSTRCCDKINSFFGDHSTSLYCLCHVANGDVDEMLPAPVVDQRRRVRVLAKCLDISGDAISQVCNKDSEEYRDLVPPMDPPSRPSAPGKKA